jgi:hypothetical protein
LIRANHAVSPEQLAFQLNMLCPQWGDFTLKFGNFTP